jgi:hypothetical protein
VAYTPSIYPTAKVDAYYGVTNWHVACRDGFSVIRLNTRDGGIDVLEFDPAEWEFLPGRYDIAVIPLTVDKTVHRFSSVGTYMFCHEPLQPGFPHNIGVGEDAFMVGLFVDHDDLTTNVPSARFGHVSMLPNERATIKQPTGYDGISYVLDMHSRTGFSGSPVFVYRTFGGDLTQGGLGQGYPINKLEIHNNRVGHSGRIEVSGTLKDSPMFKLLGIHWAQFPERWELASPSKIAESRRHLITEGAYVEGMSGMTCVIPAWQIKEVLDMPKLKAQRDAAFEEKKHSGPKAESASPAATEANPTHREDFTRLLTAAVKRPVQED